MTKNAANKKIIAIVCSVSVLLCTLLGCTYQSEQKESSSSLLSSNVSVTESVKDESSEAVSSNLVLEVDDIVKVKYTLSKQASDNAGYAEGSITIKPKKNGTQSGFYLIYFAKDGRPLDGYEPIATAKISGKLVVVKLPYGMFMPYEATEIVVYESATDTVDNLKNATLVATVKIPESKSLNLGKSYYSFASVSDVHMNYNDYGASDKWTKALNFFAQKRVNSVVVSGDMTGDGYMNEYDAYIKAINNSNFPANKIYEARGNHDSQNNGLFLKYTSGNNEIRPFENSPYFYILEKSSGNHKDNLFIFMAQELSSTSNTHAQDNFSDEQMDWLEGLLKQYSDKNTNIYIVEHAVIRNFGPGDRYDGAYVQPLNFSDQFKNNMRFKSILTTYKNVILMTGHTHLSLYDLLNYSDENGAAARMIHNSSVAQPRSYTADGTISYDSEGKTTYAKGSEGYIVEVYDSHIVYIGYNLTTGKIIPRACYILESM